MLKFSKVAYKRVSATSILLSEKAKDGGSNLKTSSVQVELALMLNISTRDQAMAYIES